MQDVRQTAQKATQSKVTMPTREVGRPEPQCFSDDLNVATGVVCEAGLTSEFAA